MVTSLSIKPQRYGPMTSVSSVSIITPQVGIEGNVLCLPLRQILIVPQQTLCDFHLQPGDLRENAIIDLPADIHALPSGTAIRLGDVELHLTFHCEPCKVIGDKVNPKAILHRRGVLGRFLTPGTIRVGDPVEILGIRFDPIPYHIIDRLKWFLDRREESLYLSELLVAVGLSQSYARGLAGTIRSMAPRYRDKVIIKADAADQAKSVQGVLKL